MHPRRAEGGGAKEALEEACERQGGRIGRGAGEALHRQPLARRHPPGIAEQPPFHRQRVRSAGKGGDKIVKRGERRAKVDEFIAIDHHRPVGRTVERMARGGLQRPPLHRAGGGGLGRERQMGEDPRPRHEIEHALRAVAACIGEDQEMIHPRRQMMGDPLEEMRPLVAHGRDGEDPHQPPLEQDETR